MARSTWKGHISFGLVQIPVELYLATRDDDLDFDLLDKRDMGRVGYKKVNKGTGEEVPNDEIAKGYEVEPGRYVLVDDDDFAKANVEATRTIDIVAFVDGTEIDPRYMVRPYYVTPTQKKAKAYALLREVLRRSGKVGIALVVLRSRQYVAALVVHEGLLVLELLRYANEIVDPGTLEAPAQDLAALGVSAAEMKMAELLVAGLEADWDPKAYHDGYRDDLLALIEAKAAAGGVSTVATPIPDDEEGGTVVDMMELLQRSLATTSKRGTQKRATQKQSEPVKATPKPRAARRGA